MNGTMTITRTYSQYVNRYTWGIQFSLENGVEKKVGAPSDITMEVVEHGLTKLIQSIMNGGYPSVNLTVELPEDVTLSNEYKTMLTTRYTADGTISSIKFE